VGKLRAGMAAEFTVDAYPGERFRGTVRQIRNAPQTVQNVVTYDAVIDVDNPELKLKPGMTANATFVYARRHDVLQVPNAALRFVPPPGLVPEAPGGKPPSQVPTVPGRRRNGLVKLRLLAPSLAHAAPPPAPGAASGARERGADSGARTVHVLRDGRAIPVRIRVGISDGTVTEVVSGALRDGERVIVEVIGGEEKSRVPPMMRRVL
jgi:HlyD family secretion protein